MDHKYNLEMTYIPSIRKESFFIWNAEQLYDDPLKINLADSDFFPSSKLVKGALAFEEDGEIREVSGCYVPMANMFQFLLHGLQTDDEERLELGDTFRFWLNLADSLKILISAGHYYPTVLTVEKNGSTYGFAHWMVSRQIFEESDLFNEWIRSIEEDILAPAELASFPIRQWLNVLLDSWTDAVIRTSVDSPFPFNVDESDDLWQQWFWHLKSGDGCFFVSESRAQTDKLSAFEIECKRWHEGLAGRVRQDPGEALTRLIKNRIDGDLKPVSLLVCLEPQNESYPFAQDEYWFGTIKVEVEDGKETSIIQAEEIWSSQLQLRHWFQQQMKKLTAIHSVFSPLLFKMYEGRFNFVCYSDELIDFYGKIEQEQEDHDIRMRFPGWLKMNSWRDRSPDLSLQTSVEAGGNMSVDSIVNFDWKVSVGDTELSFDRFKQLVEKNQRFFHHDGTWIELPLEKMQSAYSEMTKTAQTPGASSEGTMLDLLKLSLLEEDRDSQFVRMDTEKAVSRYLKKLMKPGKQRDIPSNFCGRLRPYQHKGYSWMVDFAEKGIGVCLADDMGLGKTIQTIAYLLERRKKTNTNLALIVCPTSLIENWRKEFHRFGPSLSIYTHHGGARFIEEEFNKEKSSFDVMITSYNLVVRDAEWLLQEHWHSVIIDEAQAIKNPVTKQSRVIRSLKGKHRIALTGTPMENRLQELWSIMDFINPGYLGPLKPFRSQFMTPVEKHGDDEKTKMIKKMIQPFLLRRSKTDRSIITDLPDKYEKKEYCPLTQEQATLYQTIVDNLMNNMKSAHGIQRKGLILAALTKLKQVCNHPGLITREQSLPSGKLNRFFELLDASAEESKSTLVFTQYVKMGKLLQRYIQHRYSEYKVFFLHGGLPSVKREQLIGQFREASDGKAVFILSLKTGGVGLNLTEANQVIHYDRWWNPAVENQATDRAFRIGQQENVHVFKLICQGTIEERIDKIIDGKQSLTDQIIGKGEGWVTEMNDDDIYDLIALRKKVLTG